MKEIKLTQGKVALVDDEDFEYLNQWKWFAFKKKDRNTYYAIRNKPRKNGKQGLLYMHRVILGLTDPQIRPDHKDNNGLNNQRSNLRIATRSQNGANRNGNKNSSSNYIGVSFFKRDKNWSAQIKTQGRKKHLGYYEIESDAALAYNKAAIEMFGEFAHLNKITA